MTDNDSTIPLKKCTKCGEEKPFTAEYFKRDKYYKSGLSSQCRQCTRQYAQDNQEKLRAQRQRYRLENPEKIAESARQYRLKNADKLAEYRQQHREKLAEYDRQYQQKHRIRKAEYRRLYHQQHREERHEYLRRYRLENADDVKASKLRHYYDNRDRILEDRRRDYQERRDLMLERRRNYAQKNPHITRAARLRRKARKRVLPNAYTGRHWLLCLDYWHGCCAVCGGQLKDLFGDVSPHADHWVALTDPRTNNPGTVPENMICLCSKCNSNKKNKDPEQWLIQRYSKKKAAEILKRIEAYFEWIKHQ